MKNNLTTFYIVRHGETSWNKEGRIQGHSDIPLSDIGEEQARNLGVKFKDLHFDLAFSSDLIRAKKTAELISLEKKLVVQTTETIRERAFGIHEGKYKDALKTFDEYMEKLSDEEKYIYTKDGVESDESLATRCITFLRETAVTHPGKTILVVAHGGVMRVLLRQFGYGTYQTLKHHAVSNTAWFKVESDGTDFFVKEVEGVTLHNE